MDLRPHPDADVDSYYIVSHASDDYGRSFTVLFHVFLVYKPIPRAQVAVSVLDETTLDYLSQVSVYTLEEILMTAVAASNDMSLDIRTPHPDRSGPSATSVDASFIAKADGMTVRAVCPRGKCTIAMTLKARGHILPNLVTGVIPFANGINYEYAFPTMETEGELVLNDKPYKVHGTSWFDREWGRLGPTKWTWMAIGVDGVQISLWDQQSRDNPQSFAAGERAFATLLYPDGTVSVASATISEADIFQSSKSPERYASSWSVSIPTQQLELKLKLLRKDQRK
jgi:predicted secreted hydrolase